MISKEELNRIASKTGLNLYQQEKDYLLKLFLYFYYKKYEQAVFKGGTCLKYLLGMDRFSEDLDFNLKKVGEFKEQVHSTLQKIQEVGINSHFIKEEMFADSYTCTIGVEGPLFAGTAQTQNRFRLDAGYRTGTLLKPEWKIIKSEYPETTQNIMVVVMNVEEILAEKVIALVNRKKGRDLYDIWFMLNAKIKLDKDLLKKKAQKEKVTLDFSMICSRQDYERDMSRLTGRMIPYEQVKREVLLFLQR